MLNKLLNPLRKPALPKTSVVLENAEGNDSKKKPHKAKTRLRAAYESSFDALTMLDDSGFIDCNRAALTLFGCANLDEFCRYQPSDLSPATQSCGTDSKTLAQHYIDLAFKNGHCRFEWLHQRADNGVVFSVDVLLSKVTIGDQIIFQSVLHDLSPRRKAQALLTHKEQESEQQRQLLNEEQSLHQITNNRLNKILYNIPGMVFEFRLTAEGHASLPFTSEGITTIYELSSEQVKDDSSAIFALIHPDDIDKVMVSIQESARSLQPWHMEYRVLLPKKGLRWILGVSHPEPQADGSIVWYGLKSDITARKQLEASLIQANILQEATFNSAIFSSIATDAQGVIQIFNKGAENMLGYAAEDVINKLTPAYFSDANELATRAKALSEQYGVTIASGFESLAYRSSREIHDIYELTYIHQDGHLIPSLVSITALRDADGTIIGYLLIATDHTEKKAAQLQLKTLSLALEQSQSAVMITDLNANIEYINQAYVDSSGYARADILGQNPSRFKSGKTPKSSYVEMWAALNDGKTWQGELINLNKQGEEFIEQTWISPIQQDDGTISHYLAVHEDITERKKTDALLLAAKERAENLAKTKSQFLANMSHEIRTPMTAILGFSDLALHEQDSQEIGSYLQDINTASKHLLDILNDILDVSKLDAGMMTLQLERFSLADIRTMLYGLFIHTAQAKGLTLGINIALKIPDMLIGDSLRLRQILINLLGNALKFTQQGSVTLSISLEQLTTTDALLLFAITDTGMGISTEQQQRLFQPFTQVDEGYVRNFEGTGLGLTISQDLVQLMGGSIKLDSHIGLGSCFSFELRLPLADVQASQPQIITATTLNPDPLKDVKILLVEDDAFNQKILTKVLNSLGASIVPANNGLEALAALEQDSIDIVLMDLNMPVMDGYEATLAIRKLARYAQLPIITISASVTDEEKRRCLATGMNDFASKPINKIELLTTLERWLKRE
jgi:PAS domain S-box-containing protein